MVPTRADLIFSTPRPPFSNPCRSLVPFYVPYSFSSDFLSFPSDLSPFRSVYRPVSFFRLSISLPLPLPSLPSRLSLFYLSFYLLGPAKTLHLNSLSKYPLLKKHPGFKFVTIFRKMSTSLLMTRQTINESEQSWKSLDNNRSTL